MSTSSSRKLSFLWSVVETTGRSVERLWFCFALLFLVVALETLLLAYVVTEYRPHGSVPFARPIVAADPPKAGTVGTLFPPRIPGAGTLTPPRIPPTGTLGTPTAAAGTGLPGLPPRTTETP